MTTDIQILIVEPHMKPYAVTIENELSRFQQLVGGYIEAVSLHDDLVLICNEEGKMLGLEPNRAVRGDIIAGTFIIAAVTPDGEFASLAEREIELLTEII